MNERDNDKKIAAENPPRKTITVNTLLSTEESTVNRYHYGLCLQKNITAQTIGTKG
jgi:hypothetical protein